MYLIGNRWHQLYKDPLFENCPQTKTTYDTARELKIVKIGMNIEGWNSLGLTRKTKLYKHSVYFRHLPALQLVFDLSAFIL